MVRLLYVPYSWLTTNNFPYLQFFSVSSRPLALSSWRLVATVTTSFSVLLIEAKFADQG